MRARPCVGSQPQCRRRPDAHPVAGHAGPRRGRVVNIGSAAATTDFGTQLVYAVSKAGLERFTTGLAAELAGTGVAANCVRVDEALRSEALAAMIGETADPPGTGASPEEFGEAVRWLVDQPTSFTGRVLTFGDLRDLAALATHEGVV
ncbi:SDR family oxidoreductase [Nocardia flavorosea]|uniref:SDR family oxidoreductase n=1 Tax=Nocardia flavorosea TaxID=53429 RepID=A0A846Y9U7_9NOCA|nr:SDR family oxidoreductase [Nocardia flavorosea]NKY54590.1 SDR family oxidoreductase [Nocardia flavorosea]